MRFTRLAIWATLVLVSASMPMAALAPRRPCARPALGSILLLVALAIGTWRARRAGS